MKHAATFQNSASCKWILLYKVLIYNYFMKNNTINAMNFISKTIEENKSFSIPPLQRPSVWTQKKVNNIILQTEKKYFGGITLFENNNKLNIIDGQQRMTTFLMCYKIVKGFEKSVLLINNSHENDYQSAMNIIFGNSESTENIEKYMEATKEKRKTDFKELDEAFLLLNDLNYTKTFFSLFSMREKLTFFLENSYITYAILSKTINLNEYDVFIDLNYEGQYLTTSDIVKSLFLKYYPDKNVPIPINSTWQRMLININKSPKDSMDSLLSLFLFSKGNPIRKTLLVNYYKKELESKQGNVLKNFIKKEVKELEKFVNVITPIRNHVDSVKSMPSSFEFASTGFLKFVFEKLLYKPLIPRVIGIVSKNNADQSFLKLVKNVFKISLFVKQNKINANNDGVHVMPFEIREKSIKNYSEKSLDDFILKVFKQTANGLKEETFDELTEIITTSFNNKKYGKTIRCIFDWIISEQISFNGFKKDLTNEHVIETIKFGKISIKKNESQEFLVLLEKSIVAEMNKEIKQFIKDLKKETKIKKADVEKRIWEIKKKHYAKSEVPFTKQFVLDKKKTIIKKNYKIFYSGKIKEFLKEIANG